MCYETSQLAEKLYREAIRLGVSSGEIDRLKLRSEFITDETIKKSMIRNLDEMQCMIDETLNFIREDKMVSKIRATLS